MFKTHVSIGAKSHFILGSLISLAATTIVTPANAASHIEVTIENIGPPLGPLNTSLWFGTHDGSFDAFNVGDSASEAIEFLAEEGITGLEAIQFPGVLDAAILSGLNPAFLPASVQTALSMGLDLSQLPPPPETLAGQFFFSAPGQNGGTQGVIASSIRTQPFPFFNILDDPSVFPQAVLDSIPGQIPYFFTQASGEIESLIVPLNGSPSQNRYLSFAAMFFPSNDAFFANDNPLEFEIFDGSGNFIGADFFVTGERIYDAGTEFNDEDEPSLLQTFEAFGQGPTENEVIRTFPGFFAPGNGGILDFEFNGTLVSQNTDFTSELSTPLFRITVTKVSIPEPATTVGLLAIAGFLLSKRRPQ